MGEEGGLKRRMEERHRIPNIPLNFGHACTDQSPISSLRRGGSISIFDGDQRTNLGSGRVLRV